MTNHSCRKCGNEMEINQRCEVCQDTIEFYCHGCGNITEKQIHSQCLPVILDQHIVKTNSKRK